MVFVDKQTLLEEQSKNIPNVQNPLEERTLNIITSDLARKATAENLAKLEEMINPPNI